ncbi:hypothetical protein [Streptomyces rhizosphaerihabitans]|uniref:hypothetical protein n=1 Tax=Streptomyces rhizosphaerihabitans TaxID=1266770 RepID=UPI0021BE92E3|nr:hypothetical protein [Streptomyces rhizosphaerihabitans]MCT9010491.1 hypothetical protein [Streptomyces rhizosphaerihabitans]
MSAQVTTPFCRGRPADIPVAAALPMSLGWSEGGRDGRRGRALRQAAPVLELPEDDVLEFTQLATRLETEAANGSPDPGRLQRWGGSIIGILNSPVVTDFGSSG